MEVANEYPTAKVYGIDLSPIQPKSVPENVEFITPMDFTKGLNFETGSFDLVHSR
jgi:hypothetical protein